MINFAKHEPVRPITAFLDPDFQKMIQIKQDPGDIQMYLNIYAYPKIQFTLKKQ